MKFHFDTISSNSGTRLTFDLGMLEWKSKDVAANSVPTARQSLTGTLVEGKIIYIGGQTSVTTRFDDVHFFDPGSSSSFER
jgi:hypothetical protein